MFSKDHPRRELVQQPPRAYYDARTGNSNSDLTSCPSGLCSSGSGNEDNGDAPRARQTKLDNMEAISLRNNVIRAAVSRGAIGQSGAYRELNAQQVALARSRSCFALLYRVGLNK
jgi:hypothetical protein